MNRGLPKYETIIVPGTGGQFVALDCAEHVGEVCITRYSRDVGWAITHTASGLAVPFRFASAAVAAHCASRLNEIVDWPGFVKSLAEGVRPNVADEVCRICRECGGRPGRWDREHYEEGRAVLREAVARAEAGA